MNADAALDERVAAIGADAAVLGRIVATETHLALWRRPRPSTLAWLDSLEWDEIDDLDFATRVEALESDIAEGLDEAGYPDDGRRLDLRDAIAALARRFAAVVERDLLKLRLEVIEANACRKFHSDAVTARLLTTLSGPGTQWIEAEAPDRIHQLAAGDVAIFKGRLWAETPAILHRSPPIAGTGDTRLLLVIDPFDPAREVAHG